jgi:hypothetical protein
MKTKNHTNGQIENNANGQEAINQAINQAMFNLQAENIIVIGKKKAFKYKYAPYEAIKQAVNEGLKKNNLLLHHVLDYSSDSPEIMIIKTILIHVPSGQKKECCITTKKCADPRDNGKMITYYCRYGIKALLPITVIDEDDSEDFASSLNTDNKNIDNKKKINFSYKENHPSYSRITNRLDFDTLKSKIHSISKEDFNKRPSYYLEKINKHKVHLPAEKQVEIDKVLYNEGFYFN